MKLIIVIFLFSFHFLYGQSEKDSIRSKMYSSLLYPGCEENETSMSSLNCFNLTTGREIMNNIDQNFELESGEKLNYIIHFSIDSRGMIELDSITNKKNDLKLISNVYNAFNQFQEEMNYLTKQGQGIKFLVPFDSEAEKLVFSLPIGFSGAHESNNKKNRKRYKRKNK